MTALTSMRPAFAPRGEVGRKRRTETAKAKCVRSPAASPASRAPEQNAGIASGGLVRVESAHDRFDGVDRAPHLPQMPDQRRGYEGLADIGPGRGDEDCRHASTPQNAPAHDTGKPLNVVVGVLSGECKPQSCGARRHRGRPDRDHQKPSSASNARPPVPHRSPDNDRHNGALRLRQIQRRG